jgi:hypothetical protein
MPGGCRYKGRLERSRMANICTARSCLSEYRQPGSESDRRHGYYGIKIRRLCAVPGRRMAADPAGSGRRPASIPTGVRKWRRRLGHTSDRRRSRYTPAGAGKIIMRRFVTYPSSSQRQYWSGFPPLLANRYHRHIFLQDADRRYAQRRHF